ncbi:MAG TPA: phosphodiester glycosidase family protein [Bacillaceae bacterium]
MLVKRKLFIWITALLLIVQPLFLEFSIISEKASAETRTSYSLGSVIEEWTRPVGPGVNETRMTLDSLRGRQEAFVMHVDTQNPDVHIEAGLPNGKDFGMQTVRDQAAAVSKPGRTVIGGVNGDFYDTSNGIPIGSVIKDGKILKAANTEMFGIKTNGEAIIGQPNPQFFIIANGSASKIHRLNEPRGSNQLAVYTPDRKSTGTASDGTEVILTDISGDVREAGTITAKVEAVLPGSGNNLIPEGKLVISGHGTQAEWLSALKEGQALELNTTVAAGWEDVKEALGGRITLVKNGQKVVIPESSFTTATAPRTAAGIKADGSIFFLVLDGRQPGYSEGVTIYELQELMYELGAAEALNLDGGGSSTFLSRTNGEDGLMLVNQPSDGFERSVANSFLVVSKAPAGELAQLAVQPDHLLMLAGSKFDFKAKGMDAAFNPVSLKGEPVWSADPEVGTIDQSGTFTAGQNPGTGQVTAEWNGAKGTSQVTIVNELTDLRFQQDTITLKRGEEYKLNVKAVSEGRTVYANPSNFEWEITGGIGTVDDAGTFKASHSTASGTITARYGDKSATMNVQVGKLPVVLETFENGLDHWTWSGARYQSVSIRQTTYPEPARFGNHALELNYDFTGTIGTSGAYAYTKQNLVLEDYPESIGMWVYGDGNGHWLRAQLRDGNNNAFPIDFVNNMDWTGWRYVEAKIPEGKATPLKLDLAVRLMETSNDNKNAGTIYVDNIRAVYGETNDDLVNPDVSAVYPADNEVISTNELKISAIAADNEGGTGINPERLWMYLDGREVTPEYTEATSEISYVPDEPLLDGYHQVKIKVQDHFGNETERIWQFEVDAGGPGIKPVFEKEAFIGNPFDIHLETGRLDQMESLRLHFTFDSKSVHFEGRQAILHKDIPQEHVVRNEITEDGHVHLELKNLEKISGAEDINVLGRLPLFMKKDTLDMVRLSFEEGSASVTGKAPVPLYMPDMEIKAKAHYKVEFDRASEGFESKITVTDEKGKPVKGAAVRVVAPEHDLAVVTAKKAVISKEPDTAGEAIFTLQKHDAAVLIGQQGDWLHVRYGKHEGWLRAADTEVKDWLLGETDGEGRIKTKRLSIMPGNLVIQAEKDNRFSFQTKAKVLSHLGSGKPERINLTFSEKGKGLNVTWTTSPLTTESVVQIMPEAKYEENGFSGKAVKEIKGKSKEHAFDAGEVQVHNVFLSGLKSGETYMYRAGDGTEAGWSEAARIAVPKKNTNDFSFILMGDTQAPPNQTENGFGIFTELFKKAKQENEGAAFLVHVGDMVDDGNLYTHWDAFFESMKDSTLAPSTPFVAAVGNHENIGNGVETFKRIFNMPKNGPEHFKGTVYSFDHGDAHFAVLNTETSQEGLLQQAEWLKKDMANSDKKWKIVVYHRSPYNSNPAAGSETVKEVFPPIFDELGIDLAISGHDHSYVRTFPLKEGEPNEVGTTYVIAGSTGKKFYAATPQPYMDVYFDEQTQVYTNVTVGDEGITLLVKTRDGRIVDQHTIKK